MKSGKDGKSPLSIERWLYTFAVLALVGLSSQVAQAQLNGHNIKGDLGLKSGSQAPPGVYVGALYYRYGADEIHDKDGNKIVLPGELGLNAGAFLVNVVTKKKFLGANYAFLAVLPIANGKIEFPRLDQQTGIGLSDLYLQPLNLGLAFQARRRDRGIRSLPAHRTLHAGCQRQHRPGHVEQ